MTLRDLIEKLRYKAVFNIVHKIYFKDKSTEEISNADLGFLGVWEELSRLKGDSDKNWKIYITEKEAHDGEKFIDVCWYNEEADELYAIDFVEWSELIDSEIYKAVKMDDKTAAAHILWEITFYGFTASEVKREKHELKQLSERIESGKEKLIPWDDLPF